MSQYRQGCYTERPCLRWEGVNKNKQKTATKPSCGDLGFTPIQQRFRRCFPKVSPWASAILGLRAYYCYLPPLEVTQENQSWGGGLTSQKQSLPLPFEVPEIGLSLPCQHLWEAPKSAVRARLHRRRVFLQLLSSSQKTRSPGSFTLDPHPQK